MKKGSSSEVSYLTRTGSHSTKPSRNGGMGLEHGVALVTDVNPAARRVELVGEKNELISELQGVNRKLKMRLPDGEFRVTRELREQLGLRMQEIDSTLKGMKTHREFVHMNFGDVFSRVFLEVSKHMLPQDVVEELRNHTSEAMAIWMEEMNQEVSDAAAMQVAMQSLPEGEREIRRKANLKPKWAGQ